MATEATIKTWKERLADSLKTSLDALLSNPNWGTINFENARHDLARTLDMMSHLSILPLELLPEKTATKLSNVTEEMRKLIEELRAFTIDTGDPNARRTDLVNRIRSQADNFFEEVQDYIPFLAYQKGDVTRNINELTKAITESKALLVQTKSDTELGKKEIDAIILAARDASASVGVAHFTADFSSEAQTLEEKAKWWLWTTLIMMVLTFAVSVSILQWFMDGGTEKLIGSAFPKLAVIALFFTAAIWCGRIYKAVMHQATINRHRANALKTFQAFIKATADEKVRDAVLLEATRSIFAIAASGYIDTKGDQTDNPTAVYEFVRDSSKKTP